MKSRTEDMLTIIRDLTQLHGYATRRDIANWYGYYDAAHQKLDKLKRQGLIESVGWGLFKLKEDKDKDTELINKVCETCFYEEDGVDLEPCLSCRKLAYNGYSNWKSADWVS